MAITPVQQICPSNKWNIKCPYNMTPEFIVVHNTANNAPAVNEITYMNNNNNQVSFHFAVDDKEVRQGLPLNRNGWHAGDGANGRGNRYGIAIEICYSLNGGDRFIAAEKLAAKFIAQMLNERKWGIDKVKKHQDFSGKYCPHRTLDMGWQRFVNMVKAELDALNKPQIMWIDQDKKSYIVVNNTNLVDVLTGNNIRTFAAGVGLDFVQHCTYNGKAYYRTQYSKDHNLNNGIPVLDVTEVEAVTEKVVWEAYDKPLTKVALRDCNLVNVKTKEVIKSYTLGEVIENIVDYALVGTDTYVRTKTYKDQKKSYGIELYQLADYQEPVEEPKEDLPKEDLTPPSNAGDIYDDNGDSAPNWFVSFITAIADFIKSFFKKGK